MRLVEKAVFTAVATALFPPAHPPCAWKSQKARALIFCGGGTGTSTEQPAWKSSELLAVSTSSRV